jgi:outer membrane lipoprotein carrier protein
MMFSRPGKFRWTYDKPYYQLIVGDGERLWVYDRDLNQVSTKKLSAALGASPAALLAGDNALDKNFDLKEGGTADGIEWVDAQPKNQDAGFQFLRIGFVGEALRSMELTDSFGQVTTIAFEKFERNPQLPAAPVPLRRTAQGRRRPRRVLACPICSRKSRTRRWPS